MMSYGEQRAFKDDFTHNHSIKPYITRGIMQVLTPKCSPKSTTSGCDALTSQHTRPHPSSGPSSPTYH